MEEILASIRRIIEDSDGTKRPADELAGADDDDGHDGRPAAFASSRIETGAFGRDRAGTVAEVEAFRSELTAPADEADEAGFAPENTAPQPALQALNGGREPETAAMEPAAPVRTPDNGARGAILSETTGRQVAAAFEELNDAFTASRKRSYDEIAEDIMRPMLQEWLDNNLPLLVERLVREEIERVARGGAR